MIPHSAAGDQERDDRTIQQDDPMTAISRPQVIALYRSLIRYRDTLTFTDKGYYTRRIREEFAKNRNLTEEQDVSFFYQVSQLLACNYCLLIADCLLTTRKDCSS